jgi:hypothetical protein
MSAIRPFQTLASPTLRAIMDDTTPARIRLRQMAAQLAGKLEAGNLRRLPQCELVELRALVFAIEAVADQLAEAARPPPSPPPRRWWPFR